MTPEIPKDLPPGMAAFPPSDVRPAGYPAEIPFVPGVTSLVGEQTDPQGEPVRSCTWMAAEGEPRATDVYRAMIRPAMEKVASFPLVGAVSKLIGGGEARPRAETTRVAQEAQQLVAEAPTEEREALLEAGRVQEEAMRGSPETADAVERVARAVTEASVADGWEIVREQAVPMLAITRMVTMRRAGRRRAITSMAAAFGGTVMLMETPARDEDTAHPDALGATPHRP